MGARSASEYVGVLPHRRHLYPKCTIFLVLALSLTPVASAFAGNTERPGILLNESELAALRGELSRPGWKRDLYYSKCEPGIMPSGTGVRDNAHLWLNRAIEIPAHGGHYHQFFCVDGERFELPRKQVFVPAPYRCPKCGRRYSGEKYEAAMRRVVHGWLSEAALDLALVSAIENDDRFARKSVEILLKYAQAYPGPHTDALSGGMIYQSLDEAMWVIPLAEAYDLIHDRISAPDRERIERLLRTVAEGIQRCGVHGNWGSWHLSAVGVVGYAIQDTNLVAWATQEFKRQIREELGDDGLWPESVHTYHYFPLIAFMHFAEAARHAGIDLYHWEGKPGKSLLSMFSAPLDYAYPDLRLPAIHDGWYEAFVPADVYEVGYARTRDPRFAWVVANGYRAKSVPAGTAGTKASSSRNGLYAFLFGGDLPPDRETVAPSESSINFPVLGICGLRSMGGSMLTFDYGPFLGHGHLDKMGITLFANKKLWLADYGTPGYGSAITPWYQSTFAHNTVIVDGKNQQRTKENSAELWLQRNGTTWKSSLPAGADAEAARSRTVEAYPGVSHTRTVIRMGDYFVIVDRLESEHEHTYDFYLHGEGKLSLDADSERGAGSRPRQLSFCSAVVGRRGSRLYQSVVAPNQWIADLK